MADQTDIAVSIGLIAAVFGAVVFKGLTGLTGWISYPLGALLGFVMVAVTVFILIGIAGTLFGRQAPGGDKEAPPK